MQTKLNFFKESSKALGRTALMLSGGAGFGRYHHGVITCLYEQDLLPNIISGSSAGSLAAAALSTLKKSELPCMLYDFSHMHRFPILEWTKDSIFDKVEAFVNSKSFISNEQVKVFIRDLCSDLTFLEVYENNEWILNINVTE